MKVFIISVLVTVLYSVSLGQISTGGGGTGTGSTASQDANYGGSTPGPPPVAGKLTCWECSKSFCAEPELVTCNVTQRFCYFWTYTDNDVQKGCASSAAIPTSGLKKESYVCETNKCNDYTLKCYACQGLCLAPQRIICEYDKDKCYSYRYSNGTIIKGCLTSYKVKAGEYPSDGYTCGDYYCNYGNQPTTG